MSNISLQRAKLTLLNQSGNRSYIMTLFSTLAQRINGETNSKVKVGQLGKLTSLTFSNPKLIQYLG